MRNPFRGLALISTTALIAAGVATPASSAVAEAAPAQPVTVERAGVDNTTEVVIAASMQRRFAKIGIALKPTGSATKTKNHGRIHLHFPTVGTADEGTTVLHKGGVVFKRHGVGLRLGRFRLDLNERSFVATVDGDARAEVLRVEPGPTGGDTSRIELNKLTAGMLNSDFNTHRFKAGQKVGSVRLPQELGSGASFTETIHIENNSRYQLDLMSVDTHDKGHLTSTPAQSLAPNGRTGSDDTITYASNNVGGGEVSVTYLVHGTTLAITSLFQVPTIGSNISACTQASWVDFDECSIKGGYHPEATWIITTNTATGPFFDLGYMGEVWRFHKLGAPGTKAFQVNENSMDDGGTISLWDAFGQDNFGWMWFPTADGWGQLRNENSKKCLEVNGSNGSVDQWACTTGAANQLWRPVWNPAGGSTLQVKSTSKYLGTGSDPGSVANGTTLVMSDTLNNRTSWGAVALD